MVIASTAGLLATTDDPGPRFRFETTVPGPRATLTLDAPKARFLISLRADALGPGDSDTTQSAVAEVGGTIASSADLSKGSPFVQVTFGGPAQVSALTEFSTGSSLYFTGDCEHPSASGVPCRAQLELDLSRSDGGSRGGAVTVDWSLDIHGSAFKHSGSDEGPVAPPWTIEVTPL